MKTDNHNLAAKVELRLEALRRAKLARVDVVDCFAGAGSVWAEVMKSARVDEYTAIEKRPRPGALKMDSERYLGRPGWAHNVVDLDAYGSPWRHFEAAMKNGRPEIVFLTVGMTIMGNQQHDALEAIGITFKIPPSFGRAMAPLIERHYLGSFPGIVLEAPNPGGNAKYFALIKAPK